MLKPAQKGEILWDHLNRKTLGIVVHACHPSESKDKIMVQVSTGKK
jgi:hypothetical protein